MSNVIEFKRERWCAGPVECFQCKHEWVGVWPEGLLHLYCPECDGPYGLPLDEQTPAEPEANCYGDGNVYRGVRSKDSEVKTVYVKTAEPARKPMTEEEIEAACPYTDEDFMGGFFEGVRFAEKHHGITDADV